MVNPEQQTAKKDYQKPELVEYGSMADLTFSTSGGLGNDGGSGGFQYTNTGG